MAPDVSVIIPAYNSAAYMVDCVESVLAQTLGMDRIEIIAVDDGSTDGTSQILDEFDDSCPQMRVIHQKNSGGPSIPRNRGLDVATGRYVFFLDGDDRLGREALERMVTMADEQGTDVVLGKIVGLGGRHSPGSMFTHNQPNTNVFESRAYWTLNPMKLFRRSLIDRLGLRFMPGMSPQEDQPFVATAYLNASGISIIADYECVYWVEREDGGNLSNSADLESQLRISRVMLPLIVDNVEPGRNRDHLLQRHFEMGILSGVRNVAQETDPTVRAAAFAELKGRVDDLYNVEIGMRLKPIHRIAYDLVGKGRLDDVKILFEALESGVERIPVVAEGRVYDPLPFFRTSDVPDEFYDITSRTHGRIRLSAVEWDGAVLVLRGSARLDRLDDEHTTRTIVVRKRDTEIEYEIPTSPGDALSTPESATESAAPGFFEARIDPAACAYGEPLDRGLWDIYVRMENGGFSRQGRIGATRDDGIELSACLVDVPPANSGSMAVTPYFTTGFGNVTLDVGEVSRKVRITMGGAAWSESRSGLVEITGTLNARVAAPQALSLLLTGPEAATYRLPVEARNVGHGSEITAFLDPTRAAEGSPLPEGEWQVSLVADIGGTERVEHVPPGAGLGTRRWWNGVRPMHLARNRRSTDRLVLVVRPVNLAHAIRRRLKFWAR